FEGGRFVLGTFRSVRMRVRYRSRQNDRLRVMLVVVHIDITATYSLPVFRRISKRTIPYSCCELQSVKNEVNKEKISLFLQFFFDNGENASQVAEIANGVYGPNTVTANYVQFWFHRFRSDIFDVKDAPRASRPVDENVDKITEIIEVDRYVISRSIAQELKIDHKTVLSHLRKVGFKTKLHVWCHTN
ncbi:histone-lysine N-methyltransferase SETMAR, partial [Trichonephila clavipes]